jgi:hypothetical protein
MFSIMFTKHRMLNFWMPSRGIRWCSAAIFRRPPVAATSVGIPLFAEVTVAKDLVTPMRLLRTGAVGFSRSLLAQEI